MPLVDRPPGEEARPRWKAVKLIYFREMRDQLRDRRTIFTIAVLPMALYPLIGMLLMQVAQFSQQSEPRLALVGADHFAVEPALLDQGKLAEFWHKELGPVVVEAAEPTSWDDSPNATSTDDALQRWVRDGVFDAAIVFPRSSDADESNAPVRFLFSGTNDRSMVARERSDRLLIKLRDHLIQSKLQISGMDPKILTPFAVQETNVAPPAASQAAFWSKLLPFVMLVWALTGAFYPAIDLVAGEKERGTLETLLCSPAMRSEIVWGKLLAVASFSMATALLNVAGLEFTMSFVSRQLSVGPMGGAGMPPLATLAWLLIALVPLSFLFSALALSVAAMARSSKEAQYYLMPLLMVMMPLVVLPLLRGMELSFGTALIPVTGMFLMVRALVEQHYLVALAHLPFVAGVTAGCCLLAVRWARHQFESEQVLFRADDQWGFGVWMRRMINDRQQTPSPAQSFGCGVLVLMLLFFGRMAITQVPTEWKGIAVTILAPQLGLVLFPALLMATLFTTRLRTSLRIHSGPWLAFPAAILLALLMHPSYVALTQVISHFYPISGTMRQALSSFEGVLMAPPYWEVALVLGIIPALCEELCFRGFGMAGLLRIGKPWVAVCVTALLFGMSHGILQQSISASVMGIILGIIAWRTGSVLPGILFHLTHNSLSLWLGRLASQGDELQGVWRLIMLKGDDGVAYHPMWSLLSAAISIGVLYYFWTLRGHESYDPHAEAEKELAHVQYVLSANRLAAADIA